MGRIALMLVYEPTLKNAEVVPLARIPDERLAIAAAEFAIHEAESLAHAISTEDEFIAEIERTEALRLRALLTFLLPQLRNSRSSAATKQPVM